MVGRREGKGWGLFLGRERQHISYGGTNNWVVTLKLWEWVEEVALGANALPLTCHLSHALPTI